MSHETIIDKSTPFHKTCLIERYSIVGVYYVEKVLKSFVFLHIGCQLFSRRIFILIILIILV